MSYVDDPGEDKHCSSPWGGSVSEILGTIREIIEEAPEEDFEGNAEMFRQCVEEILLPGLQRMNQMLASSKDFYDE
jgi:hypothetical protein